MAEVREFALPDLGEGLASAEVVRWFVDVGDVITIDQPVAEVETAKALVEVPCPYAGVVTSLAGPAGTAVPVGAALITVAVGDQQGAPVPARAEAGPGNILVGYGVRAEPPRPRRRRLGGAAIPAPRPEAAPAAPTRPAGAHPSTRPASSPGPRSGLTGAPAGRGGAVGGVPTGSGMPVSSAGPVRQAGADGTAVAVVSPLVRRLARDHGVDLRALPGSGPNGLIMRRDVEAVIDGSVVEGVAPDHVGGGGGDLGGEFEPFDAPRRRAAEVFTRSRREVPDATCWVDADATALLAAKNALNAGGAEPRIGLLAILARVCVAALLRAPALNSSVVTDAAGRAVGVRQHDAVHLGFAAQTPRGLAVPVVRDAQDLTTARLAAEITDLTGTARAGRLSPAQLTGGTFTLNNYGVFGVDGATPIIHHPQTAMLGVGRIVSRPWVVDGALAVRSVVQLSFTFDHRVCDGATAGEFLRFVADAVEDPTALLRHL
ncbi:dihydrolipoamide acetyltransferase family protein [Frankia sp. AgB32]|uniref:dihydrolipoamide acetyltransferase family protein n=1 Tax=Frankia sp. AgB32 TaxID=631119 RepID=UPI0020102181|nr:dihydrolipoamide acetyltransferase family protein [Frankia sp. AgB32]MCK9896834.1 2-oxo acid dehydrogenase subunit E2 [Frankia sp. AgB32]